MATTTAKTKKDVEELSQKDRLWDSLSYSYDTKKEKSDEQYRQAYSQADRQMLSRGMQRSSYGAQTLANLDQKRIEAGNNIESEKIADYENRLQQIEQQEQEADRWERQFAEGQRQFDVNVGLQERQFQAGREDAGWNKAFQEKQYAAGREDTAWNQAFQEKQADTQRDQWNATFNYQQARDAVGDEQWQKGFDQSNLNTDRQLAAGYVQAIIANGQDPTDDLLARAGLSRADANAMKAQIAEAGGGGGGGSGGGGSGKGNTKPNPDSDAERKAYIEKLLKGLNGLGANTGGNVSNVGTLSANNAQVFTPGATAAPSYISGISPTVVSNYGALSTPTTGTTKDKIKR